MYNPDSTGADHVDSQYPEGSAHPSSSAISSVPAIYHVGPHKAFGYDSHSTRGTTMLKDQNDFLRECKFVHCFVPTTTGANCPFTLSIKDEPWLEQKCGSSLDAEMEHSHAVASQATPPVDNAQGLQFRCMRTSCRIEPKSWTSAAQWSVVERDMSGAELGVGAQRYFDATQDMRRLDARVESRAPKWWRECRRSEIKADRTGSYGPVDASRPAAMDAASRGGDEEASEAEQQHRNATVGVPNGMSHLFN